MTTQIIYSNEFNKHDNINHPENARRTDIILKEIQKFPFYKELDFIKPDFLPEEKLHEVHSKDMIQQVRDMSLLGDSWIDVDTYICESDYNTARLAAGGVLKACKNVIKGEVDNAFCLVRPPGHHATKSRSMGFCLFNNAAIAANEISKEEKRVMIFDSDVHHGNGTQDIFYKRKDILYQSFHLFPHYPGTGNVNEIGKEIGQGYTINAPVSHGTGECVILEIIDNIFLPIAYKFKPEIIIISSGFDSHHSDILGGLRLTSNFFGKIISKLQEVQSKIVCTLEGGYNIDWIGKCFISQISNMIYHPILFDDSIRENKLEKSVIEEIKKEVGKYWSI